MLLAAASFSCIRDEEAGIVSAEKKMRLSITTRTLGPDIDVRIIIADAVTGVVRFNKYPVSAGPGGLYPVDVPAGWFNFYVVANEPARLTPLLDEVRRQEHIYPLTIGFSEIPDVENFQSQLSTTNIPVIGYLMVGIRAKGSDPEQGEASTDYGNTWNPVINVDAQRLASKISLSLRKQTPRTADRVVINNVRLTNIPDYGYLVPKAYDGASFSTAEPADFAAGQTFSQNSTAYTPVFADLIIPEYVMATPSDADKAVCICIEATYEQKKVLYYIPVRGNLHIADYSLKRNRHYVIRGTITTQGEMIYIPEVRYEVAGWNDANSGNPDFVEENAITFRSEWAAGTIVSGREVLVSNNGWVECEFTLTHPLNATWTATLTNPADFEFDTTGGAVSYGRARPGEPYTIRIRPRRSMDTGIALTQFYITVNNGLGKNVELNLPGEVVGTGNRYTIYQTPY